MPLDVVIHLDEVLPYAGSITFFNRRIFKSKCFLIAYFSVKVKLIDCTTPMAGHTVNSKVVDRYNSIYLILYLTRARLSTSSVNSRL